MDSKEYIKQTERTESMDFEAIRGRMGTEFMIRIIHMAMGIVTEAGEIMDALKKHLFYGKVLDVVNLAEEMGDSFWYFAGMARVLGFTEFEGIMQTNIDKLRARFPEKFEEYQAINRDLDTERKILGDGFEKGILPASAGCPVHGDLKDMSDPGECVC